MGIFSNPKFTGAFWLVLRLWLGYAWITAGISKLFGPGSAVWIGDKAGTAVTGFLNGAIAKSPLAAGFDPAATPNPPVQEWYATLVRDFFLPNATIFGYLVAYGEFLVGLALILGIFTRFAAVMGVVMNLSYLFAGAISNNPQMLVVGLLIAVGGGVAVGYYGLDYFARPITQKVQERTFGKLLPRPQATA
ncbi:MAG TPA: DoxX family protein [Roseiflexaceae bacterium]|nr:DoxX family protein [Roseiflexaceae bacterium]